MLTKLIVFATTTVFDAPHVTKDGVHYFNLSEAQAKRFTIVVEPDVPVATVTFMGYDGEHVERVKPYCLNGDNPLISDAAQLFVVGPPGGQQSVPNLIGLVTGRHHYTITIDGEEVRTLHVVICVGMENHEAITPLPDPVEEPPVEEPAPVEVKPFLQRAQFFAEINIPFSAHESVPGIPLDVADEFYAELEVLCAKYCHCPGEAHDEETGEHEH